MQLTFASGSSLLLAVLGIAQARWFAAGVNAKCRGVTAPIATNDSGPMGLTTEDWTSIIAARDAIDYHVIGTGDTYYARNLAQQYSTHFDGRGFSTIPDADEWCLGLELLAYGWGEFERSVTMPHNTEASGRFLAHAWDDQLTEWYINDHRGLEHGFTVHARPVDSREHFILSLRIRGGLAPVIAQHGKDVYFVDSTGRMVVNYAGLTVRDFNGQLLAAAWEVQERSLRLVVDEVHAHYPITIDPVLQTAYLKASNTDSGDTFGSAIAISGDTVAIGAPTEASNATGVNGNQADNSMFGAGAVYVFVRSGTTWSQQAYLKASNTGAKDLFGSALAISGNTIVVGAPSEDSNGIGVGGSQSNNSRTNSGAAYVFVRSGTIWSQQEYLKASNPDQLDKFGSSVAIDGDTILVSATEEASNATGVNGNQSDNSKNSSGAAYVFVRNVGTWTQQAYLKASNTDSNDYFGGSVAIHGDTVVICAYGESSKATGVGGNQSDNSMPWSGAAYVFTRNGTAWSQQEYIKASNTDTLDYFGSTVAISGDTLVIGAISEDSDAVGVNGDESNNSAPESGAAYVFRRRVTGWSQEAYLKASNSEASDEFGCSVAISGDRVIVGACKESSGSTGIQGDQSDNSNPDSGAAYLFERYGIDWTQRAYVKASNSGAGDNFGTSVAIDNETALSGAPDESSDAVGVDGNQSNNNALYSGAAYVLDLHLVNGSFSTYGTGTSGKGGFVPDVSLGGNPEINRDVTLAIRGGLGGAQALLIMGFGRDNSPFASGEFLVATPWILVNLVLHGASGVAGAGTLDVTDTIPNDPAIVGVVVDFQVIVADVAASKKLALSNGAELVIGG